MGTKIEWTDETLNPVVGCTKCSPGCKNCYAERMARRLQAMGLPQYADVVDPDGFWTGEIGVNMSVLDRIEMWRKPRRVFMVSMGDLFHDAVPFSVISEIAEAMMNAPRHTFQLLTKRPDRMLEWFVWSGFSYKTLPNVWVGVTAENQEQADKRIPALLQIPAAVRFVSVEPMLGPVDFRCVPGFNKAGSAGLDIMRNLWIIVGGETGPGARPMHPDWVRSLRDQCQNAGVPFFFKSWGDWLPGQIYDNPHIVISQRVNNDPLSSYGCISGVIGAWEHGGTAGAGHKFDDNHYATRVGKKHTGRLLDGHEYNEYPDVK